jgi:outer membrane protein TolC
MLGKNASSLPPTDRCQRLVLRGLRGRFYNNHAMKTCHSRCWTWISTALFWTMASAEPAPQPERQVVTPIYINELSDELLTLHPALQAARAREEAAAAGLAGVRTWDDPMLRLGGMFANEMMRAEEGDIMYGVEQKLPLFGRPRLARQSAAADLSLEQANVDYQFQVRRRDLAQALFRAALANRIVAIGLEDLDWLNRMVQTTEQRYRTGASSLVDLLRLQNEQQRRMNRVETDRRQLVHEQVVLNRLLNRALDAPWPALDLPPLAGHVPYNRELVDLALQFEPGLIVRRRAIEQAEFSARVVRRERLPEVSVGAQARNYSGTGDFRQAEVMLGFTLPWGNARRYRSDYDRARAQALAADRDAADYSLDLQEEIHLLTVRIDAARREAMLYANQIVPRSERALESAQSSWIADRGLFLDILDARRMLLDARLMHARAIAEQYDQLSELVLCCGLGDLTALDMIIAEPELTPSNTVP